MDLSPMNGSFQPVMAQFAFQSALPSVSAKWWWLEDESPSTTTTKSVRILKRSHTWASLKYSSIVVDARHVDNVGFWPADTNGVTVWWVVLSDMKEHQGGGICIAPRSHRLATEEAANFSGCLEAIAMDFPKTTCWVQKFSPVCHDRLTESHLWRAAWGCLVVGSQPLSQNRTRPKWYQQICCYDYGTQIAIHHSVGISLMKPKYDPKQ